MAGDQDQIEEKSNIIEADFGGVGPRQAMGYAMKDIEHFRSTLIVCIGEDGQVYLYQSEMDAKELALIGVKVQGYVVGAINGWLEEEE